MKTALALLFLSIAAGQAYAAEDGDDAPVDFDKVKPFTFKAPVKEEKPDPSDLKPVAPAEPEPMRIGAVHTVLDYPRIDVGLGYKPGFSGLKQTHEGLGVVFNLSSATLLATEVHSGMELTSRVRMDLDLSYFRSSVSASRISALNVQSSNASVFSGSLTGFYCFPMGYKGFKLCPGGGLGIDSFPILGFVNNTDLSLTTLNDMILRPALRVEQPLSTLVTTKLILGADFGLGTGSKDGYTFRSDHMYWANLVFDTFIKERTSVTAGLTVDSRSTGFNFQTDSYSASTLSFSAILGVRYVLTD